MLRRLRDYETFEVWSRDGRNLGRVEDFYFDEDRWTVRYIVVKTGDWLTGYSVLLSPMTIDRLRWDDARIDFRLSADQIKSAPSPHAPGRSVDEVTGYHIHAVDGDIGHIDDFMIDDRSWTIRYLMIDTSNWIGGRTVLVAPEWASRIDWTKKEIYVDVTREDVEQSPEYDPSADIDGRYEERLAESFRRPVKK